MENDKDLKINIRVSKKRKIIEVEDNGIGMSRQDLIENLGTIARSGTSKFIEAMKNKKEADISAIGQFGVGFYSSYMVADTVTVLSKNAEIDESFLWSSNGKDSYTIEELEKKSRGTLITLNIKKDAEFDPIISKASICSVTRILPISEAMLDPTFPARIKEIMVGENSNIKESLLANPTK